MKTVGLLIAFCHHKVANNTSELRFSEMESTFFSSGYNVPGTEITSGIFLYQSRVLLLVSLVRLKLSISCGYKDVG